MINLGSTYIDFLAGGHGIGIGKQSTNLNYIDSIFPINLYSMNLENNITPTADLSGNSYLDFSDAENIKIGSIEPRFCTDGTRDMRMYTQRLIDGTIYYNGINLKIDSTGNSEVSFMGTQTKEAWHTVLAPDVLFEWEPVAQAPSQTSITLSNSAANYMHMKIYYCTLTNKTTPLYRSVCVYYPQGKYVNMFIGEAGASGNNRVPWWKGWDVYINGTTISTRPTDRYYDTSASTTTQRTTTKYNNIYITRVEAW